MLYWNLQEPINMHKSQPLVKLLRTEWTDRDDGRDVKAPP